MMNPEGGKVSMGHNHGGSSTEKNNKKEDHSNHKEDSDKSSMNMDGMIDEKFKTQFTKVYRTNLVLLDAFITSDAKAVSEAVAKVKKQLMEVDMNLLKGEMHKQWMKNLKVINPSLETIENSTEIEKQRSEFATFSEALYQSIKMIGLKNETVYYKFCPMARNSKGAYWLSSKEKIDNPYFGEAMLGCGEVKEVIN